MHNAMIEKFSIFMLLLIISALPWRCPASSNQAPTTVNLSEKIEFNWPPAPIEGEKDFFTIAENGRARCALVLDNAPGAKRAAAILQLYLRLITQATNATDFKIYDEKEKIPDDLNQIHIGETKRAAETPLDIPSVRYGINALPNVNGYLIKTVSTNLLVIRGMSPEANVLGVVGFLKRYLGIRRYWPGEPGGIGDVVPKTATLKLPQIEWRDWPYFISRTMSGLDDRGPRIGLACFADFWRRNYTIPSNESYFKLMKAADHTNEPDLFPLINGKRFVSTGGGGWQPCVSNPKVAQLMADTLIETFRKNPRQIAMNLAVNDGFGDCACEKCRAMDAPGADVIRRIGLCDRYVKFDNQVAELVSKEFPDRILAFIAYGSMSSPPKTVKLHPMLMPSLCIFGNAFRAWDEWQKMATGHMGVYFYHNDNRFILPKLDIHQSARRLRYLVNSGLARGFYQEFYGIYPLNGIVAYVEQELLWDPRQSEDKILEEFYTIFFGPAAAPMKAFYETLEAGYYQWLEKYGGDPHPCGQDTSSYADNNSLKQFSVLTPDLAEKAAEQIKTALAAARSDQTVQERVKLVKALYDFALPGVRLYWATEQIRNVSVAKLPEAGQILALARQATDNGLALADYKFTVMEQPAVKAYEDKSKEGPNKIYEALQRGVLPGEVPDVILTAFGKVSEYLASSTDTNRATAWWQEQTRDETRPLLKKLMQIAMFDAGRKLDNLVKDPGFEERGKKHGTDVNADEIGHGSKQGVSTWHRGGTPLNCGLSTETAHGGKYSFAFWQTQYAALTENISINEGESVRMFVWVKYNDCPGRYFVSAFPRGKEGLGEVKKNVPAKPGEWQKIEMVYTAPPGIKSLSFCVYVTDQGPDAKIWIDDLFIGKYPE
jgi:hypothetical protein